MPPHRFRTSVAFGLALGLAAGLAVATLAQATWTDPRTWATGETVTASLINTHLRDNLDYLYDNRAADWAKTGGGSGTIDLASLPHGTDGTDDNKVFQLNATAEPEYALVDTENLADAAITQGKVEADAIDASKLEATNTPADTNFLTYDSATGGFTWQSIGFDMADWGDIPSTSASDCPNTAGGSSGSGRRKLLPRRGFTYLSSAPVVTLFATSAKPVLNYDVTIDIEYTGATVRLYLAGTDGAASTTLFQTAAGGHKRITGKSAALVSGPKALVPDYMQTTYVAYICPEISSAWMTAT